MKVLDALKYVGWYKSAHRMRTNPILLAVVIHEFSHVNCKKKTVRDGFFSYISPTGGVYGLVEESVQARKFVAKLTVFTRWSPCPLLQLTFVPDYCASSWYPLGRT